MSVLGFSVTYTVGGQRMDNALHRMQLAFERAGAELARPGKHVFPEFIKELETETKAQFKATGAGPTGRWKPLSKAYEAVKRVKYPGQPILVASGRLQRALTDSNSGLADRSFNDSMMNFGTAGVEYASFHQTGTRRMPSRPPFDFGERMENRLRLAALRGVRKAVKEADLERFATLTGVP